MSDYEHNAAKKRTLAILRLVLGTAQIMGATVSIILLAQSGVNHLSLSAFGFTVLVMLFSLLLRF